MSIFNLLVGSTAQQSAGGSGGGGGSPAPSNTGTITDGSSGPYYGWSDGSVATLFGAAGPTYGSITGQTSPDNNDCLAMVFGSTSAGPGQSSTQGYIYFSGDFSSGPHAFTNIEIASTAPGGTSTLTAASADSRTYSAPTNSTRYAWIDTVPSSPTPTTAQFLIYQEMTQTTTQDFEWNV